MRRLFWHHCALVAISAGLAGCSLAGPGRGSLCERLQSEDEQVRVLAVVEAGQTGDRQALPYLVELLDDDSAAVRVLAIESLRRMTGQDFGYRSYADPAERREAVGRWRRWLQRQTAGGGEG